MIARRHRSHRQVFNAMLRVAGVVCTLGMATPAQAVDPLYQPQMQNLLFAMGSLYFLQPLCGAEGFDWRQKAADLIEADQPEDDRRLRLTGSFNDGYAAYNRLYRDCTDSAQLAIHQILIEAEELTRDIHTRYAE